MFNSETADLQLASVKSQFHIIISVHISLRFTSYKSEVTPLNPQLFGIVKEQLKSGGR